MQQALTLDMAAQRDEQSMDIVRADSGGAVDFRRAMGEFDRFSDGKIFGRRIAVRNGTKVVLLVSTW